MDTGASRLVDALLAVVGKDQLRAVLLFGSRLVQASPDGFSAYDLVVVCERYRPFYAALARSGATRRSPALMAALNRVLVPNVSHSPLTVGRMVQSPRSWWSSAVPLSVPLRPADPTTS